MPRETRHSKRGPDQSLVPTNQSSILANLYSAFQAFKILWLPPRVSTVSPVFGFLKIFSFLGLRDLADLAAGLPRFAAALPSLCRRAIKSALEHPCFFIKLAKALLTAFSFRNAALFSMLLSSFSSWAICISNWAFFVDIFTKYLLLNTSLGKFRSNGQKIQQGIRIEIFKYLDVAFND